MEKIEKKNLKRKSLDSPSKKSTTTTSNNNNSNNSNNSNNNNNNNNNNINKIKKKQRKSIENELIVNNDDTINSNKKLDKKESIKINNNNKNNINSNKDQENDENKLVRVYADGIYDLFHFGHARSLQQAKQLFKNTYLIVGVCNDEITHKLKGKTVMNDVERAESLRHCKWVDEVVENAPWTVTQEFIDEHQIDYVSHGEDLCLDKDGNDVYQFVKDQGKFKTIKRTDGISTSDIILRIVKDYDSYVMRNLSRGYTGKQMNVGLIKETSLQIEEKYNQIKSKVKLWSDQTEHNIFTFLQRFSKRLPKNWQEKMLQSPTQSSNGSNHSDTGDLDDTDDIDNDSSINSPPTLTNDFISLSPQSSLPNSPQLNNNNKSNTTTTTTNSTKTK